MPPAALVPVVVLLLVAVVDAWVYSDARARAEQGNPVTFQSGILVLETPEAWVVACLLLFVLFFPLYLRSRVS